MAITKSAKKAIKSSARKRVFNVRRKKTMRDAVKDVLKVSNKDEVKDKLSLAYKAIDKAVKRGIIKKNTGARKKSRLSVKINKI